MKHFAYFIAALLLFAGCESGKVQPNVSSEFNTEELPAQESWNSTILFSDSGKTKAVMEVGHVRVFTQSQESIIDSGLKINFYNKQEQVATVLTARWGRVDDISRDLYAYKNVVAENDSGVTLKTEKLTWRNADEKIMTNEFVTITTPQETIKGYGFESDQTLSNYVIYRITYVTTVDTLE